VNQMDSGEIPVTLTSAHNAESRTALCNGENRAVIMRPVLVAVDVSWDSRAALLWACRHAAVVDAPVTVLHVLHDPAETPGKYAPKASDPLAPMSDTAERMLGELIAEVRNTHSELGRLMEAHTKTMNGLPAQTIIGEAMRLDAVLIVVGSRGHTGLPRLMHGSTAQRVVQLSPIPVTVVKAGR
jgi:nucleotide-binding universal stress UspA family protein